jgi:TonB family protein
MNLRPLLAAAVLVGCAAINLRAAESEAPKTPAPASTQTPPDKAPELQRLVTDPVYSLKEVDQAPVPTSQPAAVYPRTLRAQRLEGSVDVGFTITSKGVVLDPHAVSSTNEGFEQAAIDAVRKWKFKPAMKDGKAVNTKVQVTLTFSLKSL